MSLGDKGHASLFEVIALAHRSAKNIFEFCILKDVRCMK